ncbi:phosphohydrolase [Methanoregula sp.]|uniref:phosphohydrolase n=1 Tax=Methanoregula sp. TaxID=2052170 RepID=UPI003BB12DF2
MRALALAARVGEDEVFREAASLLHNINFELARGDMQLHGAKGAEILMEQGTDPDLAFIVWRYNHHLSLGTYEKPTGIALQAADSASGLMIVRALVKGGRYSGVTGTTLTKKAKEKLFAAGCDRGRIALIAPNPDTTGVLCRLHIVA